MKNNFKRKCPTCNKEIIYTNQRSYNNSLKINKLCRSCSTYGKPEKRKIYGLERVCPLCKNIIKYKSEICCYKAKRKNSVCGSCRSSLQMKNLKTRKKRIESLKKVKHTWHDKIAKNRKKNGTYKVSEEVKEKHKCIKINRMIKEGILIWPNFNKKACKIFQQLEKDLKWNGFYATKGKEKRIGRFWVDYYEPSKNIVTEYDEPYHFDKLGNLKNKDIKRQKWIMKIIGCKFYRINEKTDYEKFKNLLLNNIS